MSIIVWEKSGKNNKNKRFINRKNKIFKNNIKSFVSITSCSSPKFSFIINNIKMSFYKENINLKNNNINNNNNYTNINNNNSLNLFAVIMIIFFTVIFIQDKIRLVFFKEISYKEIFLYTYQITLMGGDRSLVHSFSNA